jgi:hypothetical protein
MYCVIRKKEQRLSKQRDGESVRESRHQAGDDNRYARGLRDDCTREKQVI